MKIRIEGCTAEDLSKYSTFLTLGKIYGAKICAGNLYMISDDEGKSRKVLVGGASSYLPFGARFVEVSE